MDGTLTIPMHDFDSMKASLGLSAENSLLEGALQLPEPRRSTALRAIQEWEQALASKAAPSEDAQELLEHLHQHGKQLAILTRNLGDLAIISLRSAGLLQYFDSKVILGRTCAPPKPDPAGIHHILSHWEASPKDAVMVGDFLFDIEAGHRAGTATIQIIRHQETEIHPQATLVLSDLRDLL